MCSVDVVTLPFILYSSTNIVTVVSKDIKLEEKLNLYYKLFFEVILPNYFGVDGKLLFQGSCILMSYIHVYTFKYLVHSLL